MASVKTTDIPEIGKFMEELWKVMKEFWIPENSEEYWIAVVGRTDDLAKKYPSILCGRMIMTFVEYLDEKSKKIGGNKK